MGQREQERRRMIDEGEPIEMPKRVCAAHGRHGGAVVVGIIVVVIIVVISRSSKASTGVPRLPLIIKSFARRLLIRIEHNAHSRN